MVFTAVEGAVLWLAAASVSPVCIQVPFLATCYLFQFCNSLLGCANQSCTVVYINMSYNFLCSFDLWY